MVVRASDGAAPPKNSSPAVILGIFAAAAAAAAALAAWRIAGSESARPLIAALCLALTAIGFVAAARFSTRETQLALISVTLSVIVSMYLADPVAYFYRDPDIQRSIHGGFGSPMDRRSGREVLEALRGGGDAGAVSYVPPAAIADGPGYVSAGSRKIVPLAGVSGRTTLACNETGTWLTYPSDTHGFRNPPQAWQEPVDVAIVGDSFGHGFCQPDDLTIAGQLRRAGARVLNLSYAGNSPLIELAAIREYLKDARPKLVLWLFYEGNDFADLERSLKNPALAAYLQDSSYRQGLAEMQPAIDAALTQFARDKETAPAPASPERHFALKDWMLLRNLREVLGLGLAKAPPPPATKVAEQTLNELRRVLADAKTEVSAWGGKMVFVYLPHIYRFQPTPDALASEHDFVVAATAGLGIPMIDLVPVFSAQPDPLSLWVYKAPGNHYNAQGYALAGKAVLETVGPLMTPSSSSQPR